MEENKTSRQVIAEKLMAVQRELKAPKARQNTFGKYKYRSCEDILEAVKPLLHKNGLALTITDSLVPEAGRVYIQATATVTDGVEEISVKAYAREPDEKKGMDDSQITGTASSYARKYALNGLFCIDDTKDADTDEWHEETEARTKKNAPAPKASGPICTDCGRPITAHDKWTAETITTWSTQKIGAPKCWDCIATKYSKKNEEGDQNAQ